MILEKVEPAHDEGYILYVSRDPDEDEPAYTQESLDELVQSGTIPPLLADTQEVAAQLQKAMQMGEPMELKLTNPAPSPSESKEAEDEGKQENETGEGGNGKVATQKRKLSIRPLVTEKKKGDTGSGSKHSSPFAASSNPYFNSYEELEVHSVMLKDRPRNEAYDKAVRDLSHLIKGKAVLDVGSGTGLLAMMCARAGARVVYAVEASGMAVASQEIIKDNNLHEIIQVIRGDVETVRLPEKVDVIISEWMGFYLLHESMLNSVLVARDRFLKKDGIMMPAEANIYAVPVAMNDFRREKIDFWNSIAGFNMSFLKEKAWSENMAQPFVDILSPGALLSQPQLLKSFNLKTVTLKDLVRVEAELEFTVMRDAELGGMCLYFDTVFKGDKSGTEVRPSTVLCTGPESPPTHWKQTVCLLGSFPRVKCDEAIDIKVVMQQDTTNPRHYALSLQT